MNASYFRLWAARQHLIASSNIENFLHVAMVTDHFITQFSGSRTMLSSLADAVLKRAISSA